MKAKTWQRHILNSYCGVQHAKNQPESFSVLRHDASVASGFEEFPQARMGKAANHKLSVTNNVMGYNPDAPDVKSRVGIDQLRNRMPLVVSRPASTV
jgi:hypothetical protein